MTQNHKNIALIVMAALIALLSFGLVVSMNTLRNQEAYTTRTVNAYAALNSSIDKRIKDGVATYTKAAPEITIDEILKSPAFKNLSVEQQAFYKGMQADRNNLIAATQAALSKRDTVYIVTKIREAAGSTDSTVSFKRNSIVNFADTTKALKWNASVTLNNPLAYRMQYTYNPIIKTTFKRNKDKSTLVEYTINDPDMKVNSIQSIVIPVDQQMHRTLVGRWLYKNQRVFRAVGLGTAFGAGLFLGAKVSN